MYSVYDTYIIFTCLCEASLTLSNLPRRGKTPYRSRPTILRPLTANVLAESPSVRINVQSIEFLPPASFASSSFGIPFNLEDLLPLCFFSWLWKKKLLWTFSLPNWPKPSPYYFTVQRQTILLIKYYYRLFYSSSIIIIDYFTHQVLLLLL